jgi:putative cardiolipin synthase
MSRLALTVEKEIVIAAAYFVPEPRLPGIRALRNRGVALRVLTNSLESTDLVAVHASYTLSRRGLLDAGVELHELRPDAALRASQLADSSGRARMGLHAKVAVFDRATVLIGSFNLDPRSFYLNTEIVLVAHSPALAARILDALAPDFSLDNSWLLQLGEQGGVVWVERGPGGALLRTGFERGGLFRQLKDFVFGLLPIRNQT